MTTEMRDSVSEADQETMTRAAQVLADIVAKQSQQHADTMANFSRVCGTDPETAAQLLLQALAQHPELFAQLRRRAVAEGAGAEGAGAEGAGAEGAGAAGAQSAASADERIEQIVREITDEFITEALVPTLVDLGIGPGEFTEEMLQEVMNEFLSELAESISD